MSGYNQPKTLLEQQCITFCSVIKSMEGHLTEHNVLSVCDKVWQWTKVTLAHEVNGTLEPPPDPPIEVENPRPDGTESRKILVNNIEVYRKGTSKTTNKPYTIWQVFDEGGIPYLTWSKSVFEIGKSYGILFKTKDFRGNITREIVEVTPIIEDDDFRAVS